MNKVPELAKRFIPFTYMQKAAAIISIGTVMMKCRVSADAAASNDYDVMRGEVMMQNGIDGADVQRLLETDLQVLLNPTVDLPAVNATQEECLQLLEALCYVRTTDNHIASEEAMANVALDSGRHDFLCDAYEIPSERAAQLVMVSYEYIVANAPA